MVYLRAREGSHYTHIVQVRIGCAAVITGIQGDGDAAASGTARAADGARPSNGSRPRCAPP